MKNLAIIPNPNRDSGLLYTKKITEQIKSFGITPLMDEELKPAFADSPAEFLSFFAMAEKADAAIVLGGDGTIISACRSLAPYSVPVFGINLGNLGFNSAIEKNDEEGFLKFLKGEYKTEERMLLDITIKSKNNAAKSFVAMNDAVITRGGSSRLIKLNLSAGESSVSSFPADGVIIATPTGSTAYSLSAGGPIVEPTTDAVIITPICPHTMHIRPMIFSGNEGINISVSSESAIISADGQEPSPILKGDLVVIKKSAIKARLIKVLHQSFYDVLTKKLIMR